jgi:sulfur relay (sulfurtransferase) complex TusBCD TusD component (DsrE family)
MSTSLSESDNSLRALFLDLAGVFKTPEEEAEEEEEEEEVDGVRDIVVSASRKVRVCVCVDNRGDCDPS